MPSGLVRFATLVLGCAVLVGVGPAAESIPVVRIGVVYDGEWDLLRSLIDADIGLRAELDVLVEGEFVVEYPDYAQLNGEWDLGRIDAAFRQLLDDDRVDVVVTAGLAASQIACMGRDGYDKPVLAPLSLDFEIQDLPRDGSGSGVRNLTYVGMPSTIRQELESFRELVPFDHVALLTNREVLEAMPEIERRTHAILEGMDIEATYVSAGRDAASVLDRIPESTDVVYVWPLLLDTGEAQRLIDGLNERRLPSFSWLGKEQVEAGMFATLSPDAGRARLARRLALTVQQILLGALPEEIDVDFVARQRLIINVDTARRIGAWPRFEALLEAEIVGDLRADDVRSLTLFDAVYLAIDGNRDLQAARASVDAALEDLASARSVFRPTFEGTLSGAQIDRDRAAASLGSAPERSVTGSLGATQLLYSDEARAGVAIERELRQSRAEGLRQAYLDTALDTSVAYLNVLRAENLVEVRRANLEVTRSNLELARERRRVGTAGQAEILRWESQIAEDRRNLVDADAEQWRARVALNQLLHEPLDTEFTLADVRTDDPELSPGSGLLDGYIETPHHFELLTAFAVGEALAVSAEIQEIEASVAAQERALVAARRKSWSPVISAQASLDETLSTSGAGSGPVLPGSPDDTDWSVGVAARLPLYSGGDRRAARRRAELELQELRLRRESVVERVETAMRTALISTRASFTSINLAQAGAEAARQNLELVRESYARGAISIIDLIDAQNSTLAAELVAADAVYDFFIDLMQVQRVSSRFDFFTTQTEREAWAQRLGEFFEERGVKPWGTP